MRKRGDLIIDRTNWQANRPRKGDLLLNEGGEPIAELLSIRTDRRHGRSNGELVKKFFVRSLEYGHSYFAGPHHESWEENMESGTRFLRRET